MGGGRGRIWSSEQELVERESAWWSGSQLDLGGLISTRQR